MFFVFFFIKFACENVGAARHIVMIKCSPCIWSDTQFSTIFELLSKAGTHLHLMTPFNAASYDDHMILGFDDGRLLKKNDERWSRKSPSWRADLQISPDDKCVDLSLSLNGLIGDLEKVRYSHFHSYLLIFCIFYPQHFLKSGMIFS